MHDIIRAAIEAVAFIGADYVISTHGVKGHVCICSLSRLCVHLISLKQG